MTRNELLAIILLASLISILSYMRSLIYLDTNSFIFHIAYLTSIVSLSLLLVQNDSGMSVHTKFLFILAWIWALMMRIPLRVPEGVISNWPDMIYELQIINNITTSGKVSFSAPTIYAKGYAFHPMLELSITELSMVSGLNCEIILKYAGPFLGLLTVVFLFGFYRSFLPEKDAIISVFLASSCFHFLAFCAATVHLSLALTFFALTLYSLTKNATKHGLITLLSIFMIISTHHYSSIIVTLYFIITFLTTLGYGYVLGENYALTEKRILSATILLLVMTASWLLYIAFSFFENFMKLAETLWQFLTFAKAEMKFPLIAKSATEVPILIRVIGDAGILLFGLTVILGILLMLIQKKPESHKAILPFATASAIIFVMNILTYSKYTEMIDLLPRAFIYLYFSAAPFSLLAIEKVSSLASLHTYRKFLYVFMITLVVVSAVYYSYIPYYHDNTSPLDKEDVRFPLHEWRSAGLFVKNYVPAVEMWGDKIAFNYIGGYGEIDVKMLPKELNVTLIEWVSNYQPSDSILILRKSMLIKPYMNYHVNKEEMETLIDTNTLLYFSGEIVMIKRK